MRIVLKIENSQQTRFYKMTIVTRNGLKKRELKIRVDTEEDISDIFEEAEFFEMLDRGFRSWRKSTIVG